MVRLVWRRVIYLINAHVFSEPHNSRFDSRLSQLLIKALIADFAWYLRKPTPQLDHHSFFALQITFEIPLWRSPPTDDLCCDMEFVLQYRSRASFHRSVPDVSFRSS